MPIAQRLRIGGQVQGVGFRPFLYRLAQRCGVTGWVRNCSGTVELHIEGEPAQLAAFRAAIYHEAPPLAAPHLPEVQAAEYLAYPAFQIQPSSAEPGGSAVVPPDYFVCGDCLAEMADPNARRYRYPFTNCTQCGPRYTIMDRLPYDRANTAIADFPLCVACAAEYADPADRRYHAQPLACPVCGPTLSLVGADGTLLAEAQAAFSACIQALQDQQIVAVKGVGGYHLLCDARCETTVQRLRSRKQRPAKALAVLLPEAYSAPETLESLALLDAQELAALRSPLRPIVIATQAPTTILAAAIAPGLREIGLMLPYSPLHHLLSAAFAAPLVATSANLSGEPVLTEQSDVATRLRTVADAFLHHNRPIRRPADDSVLRRVADKVRPLRLGRGLTPLELRLPQPVTCPTLAVGADLKNTVALASGDRALLAPHIGDLSSPRSLDVFAQVIGDLSRLYGIVPERIVCDAHPDYFSTRWAQQQGSSVQRVFHHHAHASALFAEYAGFAKCADAAPLLVFTWDGLGLGTDGNLWGGEALLGTPGHWQRVASLRPFRLIGGHAASRDAWRCALALCWEIGMDWADAPSAAGLAGLARAAWESGINCPVTTSAGRLFDGAAALLGLSQHQSYEAQAAMTLEVCSARIGQALHLPLYQEHGVCCGDWEPLLPMLLDSQRPVVQRAADFHTSLAALIVRQAQLIRDQYDIHEVGLSGGVFQNRCLTEQTLALLQDAGFQTLIPERLPVNDAALSFGQLVEAAAVMD